MPTYTNNNQHISEAVSKETYADLQNNYRAHKYVGSNKDIDINSTSNIDHIYITPEKYLYHHLVSAINLANAKSIDVRIQTILGDILYENNTNTFYYKLDFNKLKYMQSSPLFEDAKLLLINLTSGITANKIANNNPNRLIWKSATLASKGRVPKNTPLQQVVNMHDWPNFPKLPIFKYALQISAAWSRNSLSLIDSSKQLAIPQRYIFTLYCAMHAINCVNIDKHSSSNKITGRNKSRGLFAKILSNIFHKKQKT